LAWKVCLGPKSLLLTSHSKSSLEEGEARPEGGAGRRRLRMGIEDYGVYKAPTKWNYVFPTGQWPFLEIDLDISGWGLVQLGKRPPTEALLLPSLCLGAFAPGSGRPSASLK
jgi:hypothetical protein